ncbi:hypothetical protein T484DRAFT_1949586 [Baffinella frigidus]|nr:hypothetical protein T484DRAFT_1949586 [Cryptophyta sp. CCMP2293]
MSPQNECVATVKEMVAELMREKKDLVDRLNDMHQRIEEEKDLGIKVRRKIAWAEEKERSVEAMNKIVASLRGALEAEAEDTIEEMAPAARKGDRSAINGGRSSHVSFASDGIASISAIRPSMASVQSFRNKHASSVTDFETDFELPLSNIYRTQKRVLPSILSRRSSHEGSEEAGAAEPSHKAADLRQEECEPQPDRFRRSHRQRSSSSPLLALTAADPRHREQRSSSAPLFVRPASLGSVAPLLRSLSASALQIPRQVRKSVTKRVRTFSSSVLQRLGWLPEMYQSEAVWEYSM